jgi:uncharacterized protein (DUF305 family)
MPWAAGGGCAPWPLAGGGSPVQTPTPVPHAASPSAAAVFNATDVAFTRGVIQLEAQARALGGMAVGHTNMAQLREFAGYLHGHDADAQHMSGLMRQWHQSLPSPYTPGASLPPGTGPGMMDTHDWADMQHMYQHDFNGRWLDAMIHNRAAELALCRTELRSGASPGARRLAQAILSSRQAQLAQLQRWHHAWHHAWDHTDHSEP